MCQDSQITRRWEGETKTPGEGIVKSTKQEDMNMYNWLGQSNASGERDNALPLWIANQIALPVVNAMQQSFSQPQKVNRQQVGGAMMK